jgi:MarR family transcriptional regulator, lower aerobic nicotinate degradation pathway regulator
MASTEKISDLTDHLGYWLRAVSNHVSHSFAAKLAHHDITVAEWVVMRALYGQEPMAPSRVAAKIGMTKGAITKLADRLIAKSLVVRRWDDDDGRAQTLELAKDGTDLMPRLASLADKNDADFFGALPISERKSLERTLRTLAARWNITIAPIE